MVNQKPKKVKASKGVIKMTEYKQKIFKITEEENKALKYKCLETGKTLTTLFKKALLDQAVEEYEKALKRK
jgi:hypothetical protein